MKYSELIKKTIIVIVTAVMTLIMFWFLIGFYALSKLSRKKNNTSNMNLGHIK